jgi:hypothetical protein
VSVRHALVLILAALAVWAVFTVVGYILIDVTVGWPS